MRAGGRTNFRQTVGRRSAHLNLVRIHVGQIDAANVERRIGQHGLMEAHGVVEMVIVNFAGEMASMAGAGLGVCGRIARSGCLPEETWFALANRPELRAD